MSDAVGRLVEWPGTAVAQVRSCSGWPGAVASAATLLLSGCSGIGAPSLILFGAYFPGWMLCAFIGIVVAAVARTLMVATGLAQTLPLQLFLCVAIGLIAAMLVWLTWFGR